MSTCTLIVEKFTTFFFLRGLPAAYLDTASVADPDSPDPRVFRPPYLWLMDPDPSIIRQKIVLKSLIFTVMRLLFDLLSLKNDVNVPSKSKMQKYFF